MMLQRYHGFSQALRGLIAWMRAWLGLMVICSLLSAGAMAQQNLIESVQVTQQGGQTVLRVTTRQALASIPLGFSIAAPARLALDFPGTANGLGASLREFNQGDVRSVNLVQAGDRTRLVLNLRGPVSHESRLEGKDLLVTLAAVAGASQTAPGLLSRFAEGRDDQKHALKQINFRRGQTGEGRIVVDLSDASTGIDIRQQGQSLVVEYLKTQLPDSLRKRLDVADFGTPVQSISTFTQGDNVRMVIEPRGLWEHNAYQTDSQFVIEVKPVQYDPNKLVQGSRGGYTGDKLSLNFQSVEVRSVLNVIADFTDLNIITSDTVQGTLTLRLKDVPWDQALDIILQSRGLDMRKSGNVVWIAPREELAAKEKVTLEAKQQISELEPLRTENFQLNYAKADSFSKILTDDKQRILSKRGSAVWDPRTNQLFVQDVASRLEEVRKLVAKIDVPVRQVLIEARIVEATDSFSKNLGVRLGWNDTSMVAGARGRPGVMVSGNVSGAGIRTRQTTDGGTGYYPDGYNVLLPAASINGSSAGTVAFSLYNAGLNQILNLELSALEQDGKGKVVSSPRVLTADNVEALIEQGTELPYQQATSSGATSISFRKANLSLRVKPQITPDGNIIMALDVNKDSVGSVTTAGYAINTKHVKTEVLVENGGTVVIGGIYTQDITNTLTKVPMFGDLPVVGNLFRNNARSDNKTELLVFITPRVVQNRLGQR